MTENLHINLQGQFLNHQFSESKSDPLARSMIIPATLMNTELHYDDAGNAYTRDRHGAWQPHPGIAQVSLSSFL